jgi:hypothetical protein
MSSLCIVYLNCDGISSYIAYTWNIWQWVINTCLNSNLPLCLPPWGVEQLSFNSNSWTTSELSSNTRCLQLPMSWPGSQWWGLCPDGSSSSLLHTPNHAVKPPPWQRSTNDFHLSSASHERGYWYNPANDVKDLSAKLMNDKNAPPPSTQPLKDTPLLWPRRLRARTLYWFPPLPPCILTLAFLNRNSSYKGLGSSFCGLKCG